METLLYSVGVIILGSVLSIVLIRFIERSVKKEEVLRQSRMKISKAPKLPDPPPPNKWKY